MKFFCVPKLVWNNVFWHIFNKLSIYLEWCKGMLVGFIWKNSSRALNVKPKLCCKKQVFSPTYVWPMKLKWFAFISHDMGTKVDLRLVTLHKHHSGMKLDNSNKWYLNFTTFNVIILNLCLKTNIMVVNRYHLKQKRTVLQLWFLWDRACTALQNCQVSSFHGRSGFLSRPWCSALCLYSVTVQECP